MSRDHNNPAGSSLCRGSFSGNTHPNPRELAHCVRQHSFSQTHGSSRGNAHPLVRTP
ncbi:hypothetical protein FIBSPDRAFT_861774 [Athelia psychrophila]|uniref:Uncharacterized protein n=1 Tax=Athelia psychrophila TaxID=1759441 RepID=A0A166IWY4_9AGAM|nr:hypothetical protein FIBSPDRAFT_861774 [Fibularhizoctonia sp. CBS 109695]